MINAFTVDLEDWYQGLEIEPSAWQRFETRIEQSTHELLNILERHQVKATFFVLGYVAEKHPALVKEIARLGHQIGCHGYSHKFIYHLSAEELKEELRKCHKLLESLSGQKIVCFRAPFFSIRKDSLWALEVLAEEGIKYDSSIFPVHNYRYGIPSAPRLPFSVSLDGGKVINEFPISVTKIGSVNIPFSGGAYFRILPYWFTSSCIKNLNRKQIPVIFYIHPWEVDPQHPKIKLPKRISLTHYANLSTTKKKLDKLLREFRFTTLTEALQNFGKSSVILSENLARL